jgi:hypothetical protein
VDPYWEFHNRTPLISSVGYLTKEISISIEDEPSLVQLNDAYLTPACGNLAGVTVNSIED